MSPIHVGHMYSGYILEAPRDVITRSVLTTWPGWAFVDDVPETKWEQYQLISPVGLRRTDKELDEREDDGGEENASRSQTEQAESPEFQYPLIVRRSHRRLIVMSESRDIVDYATKLNLAARRLSSPIRLHIAVDSLVKQLITRPTKYALSFVHARIPAYGSLLKAASFYGEDLAEAAFFRNNAGLMNFFTCGLRPTSSSKEIVRIGAEGTLSFFVPYYKRLNEIEDVFRFLTQEGYIPTQVLLADRGDD